ncbi:Uma2 family endonuclease [Methylobacterium sp.]|uniref:Uma2 family endonuclease n=1 Tax=Methylobacterium sp. TaxID=409 RepID=UPI00345473C9
MNADSFLAGAEGLPGRHELVDGEVFSMSTQRVRHAQTKFSAQSALRATLKDMGSDCVMLPDGVTVRIGDSTVFEPDALVHCGDRPDPTSRVAQSSRRRVSLPRNAEDRHG